MNEAMVVPEAVAGMASKIERGLQEKLEREGLTPHQATNVVSEFISSRPMVVTGTVDMRMVWSQLLVTTVRYLEEVCPMHYKLGHFRCLAMHA